MMEEKELSQSLLKTTIRLRSHGTGYEALRGDKGIRPRIDLRSSCGAVYIGAAVVFPLSAQY